MPAMLIECCFIDSNEDMNRYNAEDIANAIVKGLVGETSAATSNVKQSSKENDWVRRLQEECNRQGFSNQAVDGIPGPNTVNGCPTLKYGASGEITKLIQEKLVSLGYNTNGIDGIFGNGTLEAVRSFQANNGLEVDGIVGHNTISRLVIA